jgi:hypothetical protein
MAYTDSWLWQKAFIEPRGDATASEQQYFLGRYQAMREKAALLVGRISSDLKDMTVHDISHLDALWEMGSILARNGVDFNPPEAFVYGGAILLHDAAMSLAAYDGGLAGLKKEVSWRDSYARLKAQQLNAKPPLPNDLLEKLATAEALRRLHASQAEKLPTMSWVSETGPAEFLIDDPEVRNFYGPKIGKVAHSHWWSIDKVENELSNDLGPLGGRTNSKISLLKIASMLRVSDAIHLDRRRAPAFLRKLLNPEGVSASHWSFQERMAVPFIDSGALVYSAAPAFDISVAEAWWLAFDAVSMVDKELRQVDHLLEKRGIGRLNATRVEGVGSPTELARYVETSGWVPVDSTVRVSDVPKIVATLGGSKLYGNDPLAAIRELIQNAADAVLARRSIENRSKHWGEVRVSLCRDGASIWLVVEDNGIGMSTNVLTGPLIDFGNSFWRSTLAAEEFPGLQAAGISATGKYGIGFFSVFMLGRRVRVTSRRFDKASDSVRSLEFQSGLGSRPILFQPSSDRHLIDGGTRIEVELSNDPAEEGGFLHQGGYQKTVKSLSSVIAATAPNISVQLSVDEFGKEEVVVQPDDWIEMDGDDLIGRISGVARKTIGAKTSSRSRMMPLIAEDGAIYGRAMIETELFGSSGSGCISVGGLRASNFGFIRGVLLGQESTAARNSAFPIAPPGVLGAWATEQAELLASAELHGEDKARAAQVVLMCGGDIGDLPVARLNATWLSSRDLEGVLADFDEVYVHFAGDVRYDEDTDDVHPKEFANHFVEAEGIIFVPRDLPGLTMQSDVARLTATNGNPVRNLEAVVRAMITEAVGVDTVEEVWDVVVGTVSGSDIIREVIVIRPQS